MHQRGLIGLSPPNTILQGKDAVPRGHQGFRERSVIGHKGWRFITYMRCEKAVLPINQWSSACIGSRQLRYISNYLYQDPTRLTSRPPTKSKRFFIDVAISAAAMVLMKRIRQPLNFPTGIQPLMKKAESFGSWYVSSRHLPTQVMRSWRWNQDTCDLPYQRYDAQWGI